MKVLIAGVSSRALAQSAAAAGYEVVSLDFFGDSDHPTGVEALSLTRDFGCPPELSELAGRVDEVARRERVDALVIEAGLENEPAFLDLAVPALRWFNPAAAVRGVRDLRRVRAALGGLSLKVPAEIGPDEPLPTTGHWLVKDRRHSGGAGVRDWDGVAPLCGSERLQEYIPGTLASASFVADGRSAWLVGLTRQYAGESGLHAPGYAWCGNVAPYDGPGHGIGLTASLAAAADRLTRVFGLVGLNGLDFILCEGKPYLLEVNPRPGASIELFERILGINAFELHAAGCAGRLPVSRPLPTAGHFWGKGILYAGRDLRVGDTGAWAAQGVADVPQPGEAIPAGAPVCTVFAYATDGDLCWRKVVEKATELPVEDRVAETAAGCV